MISRVFYKVEPNTPAFEFCSEHRDAYNAKKAEFADYAESMGARGWTEHFGRLSGLIFADGEPIPTGLKAERRKTSDGQTVFTPRLKSSSEGKVINSEMEALGSLPSQSAFSKRFGIPTSLQYSGGDCIKGSMSLTCGGAFENSLIAWAGKKFWVILPDIDAAISDRHEAGCAVYPSTWSVPDGLRRSTKARCELDFAAAKVAEEEAA